MASSQKPDTDTESDFDDEDEETSVRNPNSPFGVVNPNSAVTPAPAPPRLPPPLCRRFRRRRPPRLLRRLRFGADKEERLQTLICGCRLLR
ncbi:mitochondrial import inner membrane translocase subunit TIM22-2-like [Iris pallida]|uniref:Mitochondrial import inner membrane translocase subunit TIM22-2-like n=1 Tax=Iris pallida TaxID=29817 RepID=A0AAX6HZF2_IRIPA|nr:mitochondrial import inner membrane translocase subunit TIM22-2-like [Iris pallida]